VLTGKVLTGAIVAIRQRIAGAIKQVLASTTAVIEITWANAGAIVHVLSEIWTITITKEHVLTVAVVHVLTSTVAVVHVLTNIWTITVTIEPRN